MGMKNYFISIRNFIEKKDTAFFCFIFTLCFLNIGLLALLTPHHQSVVKATCQWDCFWYTSIVKNGYSTLPLLYDPNRLAQADWAFFPLYPVLSYSIQSIFHFSTLLSELAVNLVLWPVLIYLCYIELSERKIHVDRMVFALFCVIYPFNIWYTAQLSEATFGVLLMGLLVLLRKNILPWAGLICFFLSLSRPTGFLATLIIALWWFLKNANIQSPALSWKQIWNPLQESTFLIACAGAGLSMYVLYLYHLVGDGFAFSHVEVGWQKHFQFFGKVVVKSLMHKHERIFGIFFLIACFFLYKMFKNKWYVNFSVVSFIMFIAASTGIQSIERYAFSNPLLIEFIAIFTIKQPSKVRNIVLTSLLVLHIISIRMWFHGKIWLI